MPNAVPTVVVVQAAKPWWKSKVLWLNATVLALAAVEMRLDVLQPLLPANVYAVLAVVVPVANAVLRFFTSAAIGATPPAAPAPAAPQEPTP